MKLRLDTLAGVCHSWTSQNTAFYHRGKLSFGTHHPQHCTRASWQNCMRQRARKAVLTSCTSQDSAKRHLRASTKPGLPEVKAKSFNVLRRVDDKVVGNQEGPADQADDNRIADFLRRSDNPLLQRFHGLASSPHDEQILALAVPALLALAADPLLSLVDTAFVGRISDEALGALGVNSALFAFAFIVFNFLATATTPLIAQSLARGDKAQAGRITLQALAMAIVFGVGVTGGLIWGADAAITLMGAGPETGDLHLLAREYLVYRAVAAPATLVMTVGQGAFRGMQDMQTPLRITVAANVINLVLDGALIFGLGWGVAGAAAATTVAEYVAAGAYGTLLWQRREVLGLWPLPEVHWLRAAEELLPFWLAGGAVLMRTGLLLGTKALASAVAARQGIAPIAAHQVLYQIWVTSSMLIDSLAIAGQTLIAVALGQGRPTEARQVADRLLQLGGAGGLALALGFAAAGPALPGLFTGGDGGAMGSLVQGLLPVAVGMLPINAAVYVLDGVMVGAGDFKFLAGAMGLSAVTTVGVLLLVEPLDLGLQGVWWGLSLLMGLRLATLLWRYQSASGPIPPLEFAQLAVALEDAAPRKLDSDPHAVCTVPLPLLVKEAVANAEEHDVHTMS